MNNILDEHEIAAKKEQSLFSKLSLANALITLVLWGYAILNMSRALREGSAIMSVVIVGIMFLCLTGILVTLLSFLKKEPSTWSKWVGAILNVFWLLFLVGIIFVTKVADAN